MIRRFALAAVLASLAITQAHAGTWDEVRRAGRDIDREGRRIGRQLDPTNNPDTQFRGGNSVRYTTTVHNPTNGPIHYTLDGENFVLSAGQVRWHSKLNDSNFGIEFDGDFAYGNQNRGYRLHAGTEYNFGVNGSSVDIYRR